MAKKTPEEIMREAEALIQQATQSLASTETVYRDNGLDQQKLISSMNAKQHAEAEALFRKDMEEIEREVAEEAARLSFAAPQTPRTGGARKMRNMI
jgi:hypothetical protein